MMTGFKRGTPALILIFLSLVYRPLASSSRTERTASNTATPVKAAVNAITAGGVTANSGDTGTSAGPKESFGDGPWTPLCEHMTLGGALERPDVEPHHCRPAAG